LAVSSLQLTIKWGLKQIIKFFCKLPTAKFRQFVCSLSAFC